MSSSGFCAAEYRATRRFATLLRPRESRLRLDRTDGTVDGGKGLPPSKFPVERLSTRGGAALGAATLFDGIHLVSAPSLRYL